MKGFMCDQKDMEKSVDRLETKAGTQPCQAESANGRAEMA